MAQYSNLKAYIEEKIYENGTQAITGDILQDVLKVMTDDLGEFYQTGGVASPSTDPGTPDAKVIYIATQAGTYTNFGGITLEAGEVALLVFDTSWTKVELNVLSSVNGGVKSANLADGAVTTAKIADGAVETAKINDGAVTSGKVADGAIGTAKIADAGVTADKIAANAVETAKIKNGAVTEGKINDGAVTAGKVAANAVTTAKIADDAVTTAKLNDGAVTEDKIAADAVTSGKVAAGAIGTAKIADGAVTHDKIGAGAVEESNIKDGAVTSDKIANGAVGSDQLAEGAFSAENLADGSVTTDKLADEAVTAEKIADGAVTAGKFANGSVTTIKLGSGAVTTEKIGDGMVTRQKLADSSVGTSKIIDGAVTTDKVADGAITDAKLENPVSVSQNTEIGGYDLSIGGTKVLKGISSAITGTISSAYSWLQAVYIPQGAVIRNLGVRVRLYETQDYDAENVAIPDGGTVVAPFSGGWLRASSDLGQYKLLVYLDADTVVMDDGTPIKEQVSTNTQNIANNSNRIDTLESQIVNKQYTGEFEAAWSFYPETYNIPKDTIVENNGETRFFLFKEADHSGDSITLEIGDRKVLPFTATKIKSAADLGDFVLDTYGLQEETKIIKDNIFISSEIKGTISTAYIFIKEDLNLSAGTYVMNNGNIRYALFKTADNNDEHIILQAGDAMFLPFDVMALKSLVTGNYSLKVYNTKTLTPIIGSHLGANAGIDRMNTMAQSATSSLDNYPYANKKGDQISFSADITSFTKIRIGKGYMSYNNVWFEIDSTNVVLKHSTSGTVIDTQAHGLTISDFIKINISFRNDGSIVLNLNSLSGRYQHTFAGVEYSVYGRIEVHCITASLTNTILSATNPDFRCPVWMFGDSYFGIVDDRWPGQLKNMGYFNYLNNALAGRASSAALSDIKRALNFGTPKYLVFMCWGNDFNYPDTAIENIDKIYTLCQQRGIEMINYTMANVLSRNGLYEPMNQHIKAMPCRYVDIAKATNPNGGQADSTWYTGYLSGDGVHPTELGAIAQASQVAVDFPEIMQYGTTDESASNGGNENQTA